AVILARGRTLGLEALPDLGPALVAPVRPLVAASLTVDEVERAHVTRTLVETDWVIEGDRGAARRLGLHPNTLRSRLKRWGIKRPNLDVLAAS
ncbi:MAG TPA: helix-turn-helix domain-containing protein, partial [Polyangia bacterium]|nr:helix-turn-helix domain-containing protein [Polyangia bacterium]